MKTKYVIRREYTEAIRRKSFIITTFVLPAVFSLFFVIPAFFANQEPQKELRLAVVDQTGTIAPQFATALMDTLKNGKRAYAATVVPATGSAYDAARAAQIEAVKRRETDIVLAIPQGIMTGEKASYITREQRNMNVMQRVEKALNDVVLKQRLAAEGIDYQRVKDLTAGVSVEMNQITAAGGVEKKSFMVEYGIVFIFVTLLNLSIQVWGVTIAKSIVEEKSSRIIEVLLSALTPRDLVMGKLVGVGLAGFTQLGIWTAIGLAVAGGALPFVLAKVGPLHIPPITFLYFVIFFILGFLFYASIFMMIGAISSTDQDAQQMQVLVQLPMVVPFMLLLLLMQNPSGPLAVALSLFPPFTAQLMMARIILLTPPLWQILLGMALMLVSIFLGVTFAARIFRVGILMHGKRPNLRELIHWYRMAG
ncbi:MAG TPA: ABC transporter permease [Candidatus Krumholzibacteria bacterium]|nr:ABC transporter permease [Candidatus Krumholzibacteria bacterium]